MISSKGNNHKLEELRCGRAICMRAQSDSNKNGQWQLFDGLFVTLRWTVDVTSRNSRSSTMAIPMLRRSRLTSGDRGEARCLKIMTRPEQDIDDNNPFDEITLAPSSFSHTIGPKSITGGNQSIGVRVSGHEHDGFLEADEFAGSESQAFYRYRPAWGRRP